MQSAKRVPNILPANPDKKKPEDNAVVEPLESSMTTPEVYGPMQPEPMQPVPTPVAVPIPAAFAGMTAAQVQERIKEMQAIKAVIAEDERLKKKSIPRGRGVMDAIKKAVYEDPKRRGDDLLELLRAQGVQTTRPSLDTMRSDFLHSMRVLKELGALTDEAAEKVS